MNEEELRKNTERNMKRFGVPKGSEILDPVKIVGLEEFIHGATNHPPTPESIVKHEACRDGAIEFARDVLTHCPASRERSLAITKIEEALMWARKAIAVHQND